MNYEYPLSKPYFDQDELEEIKSVLDSGWVAGGGPKCSEFEEGVQDKLNVPDAIAVSSCTTALHLSLSVLGVNTGDEVIVADFSFPATGLAVMHAGATPVFVDVDPSTYNIDNFKIKELINPNKTKAIVAVHTFGNPCKLDDLCKLAEQHGLFVIEDAACAFGSTYRGKSVGLVGDVGCFSFHARKGITTGEGGMIITKHPHVAKYLRKLSMFGVNSAYARKQRPSFQHVGYNYKMSDITAAVGVAQLRKLDKILAKRRELAKIYNELLEKNYVVNPQYITLFGETTYQSYVGTTPERDLMISRLAKKGIEAGIGTYAQHCQPVFASKEHCKNSESLYRRTISLPIYYDLTEENIHTIVEEINKCR